MSSFTDEDVQQLSRVGNEAHNAVYMARFTPREYQIPNGSDTVKLKEFIRMKYVDRRWYGDATVSTTDSNSTTFSNFQSKPSNPTAAIAPPAVAKKSASLNSKTAAEIAASMDLLSLADPITPPKHPAEKVFSRSASLALPPNASQDPFSSQVPAATGQQPTAPSNFDPFNSGPAPNVGGSPFDPFGSSAAHSNSIQSTSNGSFDPFGDATSKASAGAFPAFGNYNNGTGYNAFSSPHTNPAVNPAFYQGGGAAPMQPLPFIKIAPPQPAAPAVAAVAAQADSDSKAIAAAAVTGSAASAQPKNFSAFDDLLDAETAANPFANPSNFGTGNSKPAHNQNQAQAQAHAHQNPHHPNPAQLQGHPSQPHPNAPQPHGQHPHHHPQAYGPYSAQPGYAPYPAAYGGYPNPGYGYPAPYPPGPQAAYPPQAPYGYGATPPDQHPHGNYPAAPQQHAPGHYGYGGAPPPHLAAPAPAPSAATVAPDPFEHMSGLAWSALGSKAPPSSAPLSSAPSTGVSNPQPRSVAPAPAPVPAPAPALQSQSQPAASVNPFDMF